VSGCYANGLMGPRRASRARLIAHRGRTDVTRFLRTLIPVVMLSGLAVPAIAAAAGFDGAGIAEDAAFDSPAPPLLSPSSIAAPWFGPPFVAALQQPAGPPATPRHTGLKAMVKQLGVDVKLLPSRENLLWVGIGSGLALAVHPADDNVNAALVGNSTAENFFRPGRILGSLPVLLGSATAVYAVGRIKDQPRVSHVGMDLIRAIAISEGLTQALKYTVRRERPDGSSRNSFPSGHAADTFAFATAFERHLGWRWAVPAYVLSSYVAISRLPANRHWLSDTVFGSAVGIIAGRTVTTPDRDKYPVSLVPVPGGFEVAWAR
jgi:membrane-associated phospholipid phosphatase